MRFPLFLISCLFLFLNAVNPAENELRVMTSVMTYNIHLESCEEQLKPWDERKSMVAQLIHSRRPEILGLQGATLGQTDWLNSSLKEYEYYAPPALHLEMGADICPILYSRNVYEALDQGTFLIGEAKTKVNNAPSEVKGAQFLNWVKLKHLGSQKELYVLNTRMASIKEEENRLSTQELQEHINRLVGDGTFVLVGDMAHNPETSLIQEISNWANDSEANSLVSISETEITHPGWTKEKASVGERVDYVFLSFDIPANSYEVLDVAYDGAYPSDHLPVFCRLRIQ